MLTSRLLVTLGLVWIVGSVPEVALCQDKSILRVGVIKNFPPYYMTLEDGGKPTGFAVEFTEKVARRINSEIHYQQFETWPQLLRALKAGEIDLVPNLGDTPERRLFADFASPVRSFPISIFVRREDSEIQGPDDIDGRRISVVEGNVGARLMAARPRVTSVMHASPDQALISLISGKTDALIYPRQVLLHLAREAGLVDRLKTVGPPLLIVRRGIALRKGQPELLVEINSAIEHIVRSSDYSHMVETWFGEDPNAWSTEEIAAILGALLFATIIALSSWRYVSVASLNRQLKASIAQRDLAEQRFQDFSSSSTDWYWEQDAKLRFTVFSERYSELSGLKKEEILGRTREELRAGDIEMQELKDWQSLTDNIAARRSFQDFLYWTTAADGTRRCISTSGQPKFDDNGAFSGYRGVGRDVTAFVTVQKERTRLERQLGEAIEAVPAYFALFDANDRLLTCNTLYREAFELGDLKLVPGIHIDEIIEKYGDYRFRGRPAKEREIWVSNRKQRREKPANHFIFQHGDNEWVDIRDFILQDGSTITLGIDITAQRESEQMLRLQERALASTPSGLVIADAQKSDLPIVFVNSGFERITGYQASEAIGKNCRFLQGDDIEQSGRDILQESLGNGNEGTVLLRTFRKDGQQFWNELRIAFVRSDEGEPTHVVGILNDVSERIETEAALHRAQKLEAAGQLASGMAHDLNNILTVLRINVDLLQRRLGEDPKTDTLVQDAIAAIDRGSDLTKRLLNFAKEAPHNPEIVDLAEVVSGLASFLQRSISGSHCVEIDTTDQRLPAMVDVGLLENALLNLTLNARDAMPDGGSITIASHSIIVSDPPSQNAEGLEPGAYAAISVIDSGIGMTSEVKDKVFEPFFTTKDSGKGTGLGLSMVYGFAGQSGGSVTIDSVPDEGSTVTIYLPLREQVAREGIMDEGAT